MIVIARNRATRRRQAYDYYRQSSGRKPDRCHTWTGSIAAARIFRSRYAAKLKLAELGEGYLLDS